MKPILPSPTPARRREWRRAMALTLLTAGALCPVLPALAQEEEPADPEPATQPEVDPASLRNWVELSLGGTAVSGDTAAMRYRTGLPKGPYGGILDFHYETDVDETTLFQIDGRGIFGNEDYSIRLELNREEVGFVRGGFSQFRTYSDGSGGYLPTGNVWHEGVFNDALELDRREFWFETGLRLPAWPEITLRYQRSERDGQTASTAWGTATTPAGSRSLVPAFLDLDEARDLVTLDARKTFNLTTVGVGLRYEHADLDNRRNLRFFPGEASLSNYATQRDTVESDMFNARGSIENRFNDRVWLTAGYAYTHLDADNGGYRVYGNGYDPDFADRLGNPNTFDNLIGTSRLAQHVANLNLYWNLADPLELIPSLRLEKQDLTGRSTFENPAFPSGALDYAASSDRGLLDVAGALELRYRGITNIVLHARGEWLAGEGDLDESYDNITTVTPVLSRSSEDSRFWQKYTVGAAWYPHRRVSLGTGYYHKIRDNDFDHRSDSTPNPPPSGNRYPAYITAQKYTVDNVHVRATWRPRGNVTLVARYDLQLGEIQNQPDGLLRSESAEMTSHILSGSLSWVPLARLYLQARGTYANDQTESQASIASTALLNAENDYWTAHGTVGYADVKANWSKHCTKCHGEDGKGQTTMGKKLKVADYTDPKVQAKFTDEEMIKITKEGKKEGSKTLMKGYSVTSSPSP
jgi:hypothetical protein